MATSRSHIPAGFDDIHRILGAAMRATQPEAWNPRPHRGGPMPVLSTRRQVDVGVVVCQCARARARTDEERAFLDEMALLAEEVARLTPDLRYPRGDRLSNEVLDRTSKRQKQDGPIQAIAKLAVRAAFNHRYAPPSARNAAGTSVERAAETFVTLLADDLVAIKAFLDEVDAALVRLDLEQQLDERAFVPSSAISRVLSRPPATRGKSLGLAFASLSDGRHALYVKLKQRWTWHEGDRETMFATVPDEYMAQVIEDLEADE